MYNLHSHSLQTSAPPVPCQPIAFNFIAFHMSYSMEYSFGQFSTAVLVCPIIIFCLPNHLISRIVQEAEKL